MTERMTHQQALELLPWLANETLDAIERERLERHLRDCLVCHAELKSQRALHALVKEQPTVGVSAERDFDALLARVDERDSSRGPARALGRRRRWWPAPAGATRLLAGAAAALAAAITVVAWLSAAGPVADEPGAYSALAQPAGDGGPLVDIVFAQGVSETQMRALLREIDATIVTGPSDLGRYTVRAAAVSSAPERDTLVQRLRADARVRFAGPAFIAAEEPAE